MDEELKKLIESTAAETQRQFAETHRQFADMQGQFAEMRRHVDETAAETRRHVDETAAETRRHVDETAAETHHLFHVVTEGLNAKIDTIADGVLTANERIDRLASEMATEFNDTRSMIKFSHHELDRRVRTLEEVVSDLQVRVDRLESTH